MQGKAIMPVRRDPPDHMDRPQAASANAQAQATSLRTLAVTLALASIALAGLTAYLAEALELERTRNARATTALPAPSLSAPSQPVAPETPARIAGNPAAEASLEPPDQRSTQADALRTELNDPVLRARRVADIREAMVQTMVEMAPLVPLQPQEAERLLDVMAESMVADRQRRAECRLTPRCDPDANRWQLARDQMQEIERAAGVDVVARLNRYEGQLKVREFDRSLPVAARLSDIAAADLAHAFAEERRLAMEGDAPPVNFAQVMDARAASLLTAEQLELFRKHRGMRSWE